MNQLLKILILEDSITDAELIQRFLIKEKGNCEFRIAMNRVGFITDLNEFSPDIILSDNSLPQFSSSEALEIARHHQQYTAFILVTGNVSEEFAANILKEGADDYILKDRMARLPAAIDSALQKKRAEKELEDYKYAIDKTSIVAITDRKGTITFANDNFSKISKYSIEELIGQDHRIINSGVHSSAYIKNLWHTIASGRIWKGEFCNKAKDESLYWVDTTIIPFLNQQGKPYQYLSIRTDISARKKMEDSLQKSTERFKYVTQATSDVIWELNFDTKQYIVHEGKGKLFDAYRALHWQPEIDDNHIVEEERKRIKKSFTSARRQPGCELWNEEYKVYANNNAILNVVNHAIFIRDENGIAKRVIGAITDITEKKKLETDLLEQQKNEHIRITTTALDAQEKERNLIGIELHDNVNQILVGTKLVLAMIKDNPDSCPELIPALIENIESAIYENRKIAHELVTPDFEVENFRNKITQLAENMLTPSGISIDIDNKELDENKLDGSKKLAIYRMAQEHFTNISKYSKAKKAHIKLSTLDNYFSLMIVDDGVGMDTTKQVKGIGLKNIKGRLSIFNGNIKIITSPGNGFGMYIKIPLNANKN